jgi:hypothetical protein
MAKVGDNSSGLDDGRVTFERRPDVPPAREPEPERAVTGTYQLSEPEAHVLRWALEQYLPELGYEVARIKLERDRHELVLKEEILSTLLTRLSRPPAHP